MHTWGYVKIQRGQIFLKIGSNLLRGLQLFAGAILSCDKKWKKLLTVIPVFNF